ncbi:hypothetical protein CI102_15186 [Trichoderma harzianum]|nr:hypothetical protein CI102_15186 [Trichoderma harzianum]
MTSLQAPANRKNFHVAIICARSREANAVMLLFDQFWDGERDQYGRADGDENHYITGCIGGQNVVLAVLPDMGANNAAAATASLRSSYTSLRLALLVGICGGVPRIERLNLNVYLGDVVVSKSIIQYDYGRQYAGHFAIKNTVENSLGKANKDIQSLLAVLRTEKMRERLQNETLKHLQHLQEEAIRKRHRADYRYPGAIKDNLYSQKHVHQHRIACDLCAANKFCKSASEASCVEAGCSSTEIVARDVVGDRVVKNGSFSPEIHIGKVGSGNTIMMSGSDRDQIAARHNIIAFETEGAGAWDEVPCIVIKGISNYADSHKNKDWRDFAAATAASVAKAILGRYIIRDGERVSTQNQQSQIRGQDMSSNSFENGTWINQGKVGGYLRGLRNPDFTSVYGATSVDVCYRCDIPGHGYKRCYASDETVRRGREARAEEGRCQYCGQFGHQQPNCWQRKY